MNAVELFFVFREKEIKNEQTIIDIDERTFSNKIKQLFSSRIMKYRARFVTEIKIKRTRLSAELLFLLLLFFAMCVFLVRYFSFHIHLQ